MTFQRVPPDLFAVKDNNVRQGGWDGDFSRLTNDRECWRVLIVMPASRLQYFLVEDKRGVLIKGAGLSGLTWHAFPMAVVVPRETAARD